MKHDPLTTANALATTTGVVYIACRILIWLFPDLSFTIGAAILHGVQLQKLGSWDLTTGNFVLGLIAVVIAAWLIGWCFAHCYNFYLKRQK